MKISLKGIILVVLAGIVGVALYIYSYINMKKYFKANLELNKDFLLLQLKVNKLKLEILKSSSFLYYNYDNINKLADEGEEYLHKIKYTLLDLGKDYQDSFRGIQTFDVDFYLYSKKIQRYLTLNAALKNSILNIPTIQIKASKLFKDDTRTMLMLIRVYDEVFIAKNAMDNSFIMSIKAKIKELDKVKESYPKDSKEYQFLESLKLHLVKFVVTFPLYNEILDSLLNNSLDAEIVRNIQIFQKDSHEELVLINRNITALLMLYIISLIVISLFIYKVSHENRELKGLKLYLENLILQDLLTGLKNMKSLNIDLKNTKTPHFILINIDKFKHINEFYGIQIGDLVLMDVARVIKSVSPKHFFLYRLSGDDFGILFEGKGEKDELEKWVQFYIKKLENYRFEIDDMVIELRFSMGASSDKERIFETADMALKMAKNLSRKKYVIYSPKIDKSKEIKQNIETISNISLALKENRLKAYFQPIFNIKTNRVEKYEALARIELRDGSLLKPFDFMKSAIEAKLSGEITLSILRQILDKARESEYEFSINISSSDIEFYRDREAIINILTKNHDVAHKIIFEILESEEIYNYKAIDDFIYEVKKFGCKVAIDDFGSGYSNFEKMLNLDIDILKVDGSLIQNIDTDEHSELITNTILRFAKYANFSTIAEFVHSESIYCHIKRLGFTYAQGYYIGEPKADID
jgi:diguanylate cyclase (GGDEF)-like protein